MIQNKLDAWKQDPGAFAIAGGSAGGTDHMLAGLLAARVGMDPTTINYVPHSGGGESIASILGEQVTAGINGLSELVAFIESGRMRALAISSEMRAALADRICEPFEARRLLELQARYSADLPPERVAALKEC